YTQSLLYTTPSHFFCSLFFFFSNDPPTTAIYTLSLHDALPSQRGHHGDKRDQLSPRNHSSDLNQRQSGRNCELHGGQRHQRGGRSEEHTSELQSQPNLVCRLLLEKKKNAIHT